MAYGHDHFEIERRLKSELDKARDEYGTASRELDLLFKDIPSGIPHPDGELRIRQTGEASRAALRKYTFALKRFSQFTLAGIVPEDMTARDSKPS
jgi:hypothetical protein